jgi:cytochrome c peroxidase
MKKSIILSALALVAILNACKKDNLSDGNTQTQATPSLPDQPFNYFSNSGNPALVEDRKATLGRVLFYDKHLSLNNAVSCASCHKQEFAFSDNVAFSRGFENRLTGRNSMAIQNLNSLVKGNIGGFGTSLFWDGRESNVVNLIMRPVTNHVEMGIDNPEVLPAKLSALPYYKDLAVKAYGDENLTTERISECIAMFISSITSENTRFDKDNEGEASLTANELFGKSLFFNKYNCSNCHVLHPGGYTGRGFFNIGLDAVAVDKGRGDIDGEIANGMFKAPNLRNVALTAPYMHDGRFASLKDVIRHYSRGINEATNLATELRDADGHPMRMNISEQEEDAIIAFLGTLTDKDMITDPKFSDPFVTK